MDFKALSDPVVLFSENKKPGFFKNKKILGGLLTVFLLFAVGLGVYISGKPTQFFPQAGDERSELLIQPQTLTASLNEEVTSDLYINTNGKIVSKVELSISYDPVKLKLLSALPGTFLDETTEVTPVEKAAGTIKMRLQKKLFKEASGSGILASLKFRVIASSSSQTTISFVEKSTKVTVKDGDDKDKIKSFKPQTITLNPAPSSPSPSPSGSSQASPSPSPSSSPSSSPSPASSGSPSPSPSSSPSTSPSPSPSPSSTQTQKGDGNNDGKIDLQDLSILYSKWSPAIDITSHFQLDFNNDRRINSFDLSQMNALLTS
ncbi:hypothetical protein HYW44_02675 [Candidatus Daviesbacteria bacterium]|nr:hypothetical protein [Candidatus Daviesbacteria bacterium]